MSKEEIIQAIKECAAELGRAPSIAELVKMRGVTKASIYRKLGNYQSALALCGLERSGPGYQTDLRSLFADWATVARKLLRLPTMGDYEANAKYSIQPLLRRYGTWGAVPAGMAKYVKEQGLEREWADVMELIERGPRSLRGTVRRPVPVQAKFQEGQPIYGTPMMYSALTFAPTHEDGVIFLFGALAKDLGFTVLRIQPAFPDCEAMREIRPGVWQRARIEFEHESRNFLAHGHPVSGCDVIVCWEHNWEGCPLEVIELRRGVEGVR